MSKSIALAFAALTSRLEGFEAPNAILGSLDEAFDVLADANPLNSESLDSSTSTGGPNPLNYLSELS